MKSGCFYAGFFENSKQSSMSKNAYGTCRIDFGTRPPAFDNYVPHLRFCWKPCTTGPKKPGNLTRFPTDLLLFFFGNGLNLRFIARVRCLFPETNEPCARTAQGRCQLSATPSGRDERRFYNGQPQNAF